MNSKQVTKNTKLIIWSFIFINSLYAQIPTGQKIIKKMNDILTPTNSKGMMTQTIQTSSGKTRTFEFEMYSANRGEKNLMRYIKPARVRGQAFLMLNYADDIWAYFPRTKRVRKLATHAKKQKVQGSDFTYEDLGSGDTWVEDYETENLGREKIDGVHCWKVESVAKEKSDVSYSKVVSWVKTDNFYPLKMDYYNEDGDLFKTLFLKDIKIIDDYPTAMEMVMKNLEDNSETKMAVKSVTYDWRPSKDFFSERNLKK